jgi:putative peptide zinc metalloprotease protein
VFGELELLHGTPPVASVVALSELTVVTLPHAAIAALLHDDQALANGLARLGNHRLLHTIGA